MIPVAIGIGSQGDLAGALEKDSSSHLSHQHGGKLARGLQTTASGSLCNTWALTEPHSLLSAQANILAHCHLHLPPWPLFITVPATAAEPAHKSPLSANADPGCPPALQHAPSIELPSVVPDMGSFSY
jgi:hypothetical protein